MKHHRSRTFKGLHTWNRKTRNTAAAEGGDEEVSLIVLSLQVEAYNSSFQHWYVDFMGSGCTCSQEAAETVC